MVNIIKFGNSAIRQFWKFGKFGISEEKDVLKGKIEALDESGNPFPGGVAADDTTLSIEVIADKKVKKQFIGKSEKDLIDFNLRKAFPNDNEIAGLLKKQKDEAVKIDGDFRFTINEITRFIPAELNQELFDSQGATHEHS